MPSPFPQREIEEQIHEEFEAAFNELQRACGREKIDAAARLNLAVRRLYDFVGYGKVCQRIYSPKHPGCS